LHCWSIKCLPCGNSCLKLFFAFLNLCFCNYLLCYFITNNSTRNSLASK
jgi:hypothetical protein